MKKGKKYFALLLAGVMFLTGGCGGGGQQGDGRGSIRNENSGKNQAAGEETDGKEYIQENEAGRYLESDLELPETVTQILDIQKLSDGSIALLDGETGYYVSADGGESFEPKPVDAFSEWASKGYIYNGVIGKDGSLLLECVRAEEAAAGNAQADDGEAEGEGASEEKMSVSKFVTDDETGDDTDEDVLADEGDGDVQQFVMMDGEMTDTVHVFVDADGNAVVGDGMGEVGLGDYCITEDGTILAASNGVYELDFDANQAVKLCDTKGYANYIQMIGERLYIRETDTMEIYDMVAKEMVEDEILKQFVEDQDMSDDSLQGAHAILFYPGDTEDSIYVASSQGVFRHVVGGSVMEEIIKGSLSSMGAPNFALSAMAQVQKDCFLIAYNANTVKKYVYDPEAPAVPENELKVYSLKENDAVRMAINRYQNEHPDTYLSYEVGMSGQDGETVQDAVRSLNTSLLSGEGPDILVLDGLPAESYMEKGILEDLTDCLKTGDEMNENIVKSYEKDGKILEVPVLFELPIIAGEDVAGINSLSDFADYVEEKRKENPSGSVTGSAGARSVLNRLYDISAVGFMKEDGSVDKEKLTEYLTMSKRIWDADKTGLEPEIAEYYEEVTAQATSDAGFLRQQEKAVMMYTMGYAQGKNKVIFGNVRGMNWDYSDVTSVFFSLQKEGQIRLMNGLSENVFVPNTILAVNQASEGKEAAKEFVKSMLSKETQKELAGTGLLVNKTAMLEVEAAHDELEEIGSYCTMDEDGVMYDMVERWPKKEEMDLFNTMIEQLTTPAYLNDTVKDIIMEQGVASLQGEKSIEDAVGEILNSVQIYLAE